MITGAQLAHEARAALGRGGSSSGPVPYLPAADQEPGASAAALVAAARGGDLPAVQDLVWRCRPPRRHILAGRLIGWVMRRPGDECRRAEHAAAGLLALAAWSAALDDEACRRDQGDHAAAALARAWADRWEEAAGGLAAAAS